MNSIENRENNVNGAGTSQGESSSFGRGSWGQQRGPGRRHATARTRVKWTKELNKIIMECYYRSEPKKRRFRKRMYAIWQEKGLFEASEQQVAGQALCIRKNQWLSNLELEEIKRKIDEEMQGMIPSWAGMMAEQQKIIRRM